MAPRTAADQPQPPADDSGALACAWQEGDTPERCRFRQRTSFLSDVLGLDALLNACTAFVHGQVRAEHVRFWLHRMGGRYLVHREYAPTFAEGYRELRRPPGEGLAGRAALDKRTYLLGPSRDDPKWQGEQPPWQSALAVPMVRRGQVLGVMECRDKAGGGPFTPRDARLLESVAGEFSAAIENAQLYFDIRRRAAERAVLLRVARALSQPLTLSDTLEAILDGLRRLVSYDAAAIYLLSADGLKVQAEASRGYPPGDKQAAELLSGQGIVNWVARTGESVIVPDTSTDKRYLAARPTTRSEMACPLIAGGKVLGVFNLESDRGDTYSEGHLEVLLAFASQAAATIERARLLDEAMERRHLERELAIARQIQTSFLPKADPQIAGYDVSGVNMPYSEVGGDYFDFIPIIENQTGIAISDVSGKGIPAALLMAAYRASLLAEIRNEFAMRTIFAKVNLLLYESTDRGKFVTAFYAVLDSKSHVLTFSNAGHDPPILLRADGSAEFLREGGLPMGILPTSQYEERRTGVGPGDVLLLYTDGVSEATNAAGEQFGPARIEALVRELRGAAAREIVRGVVAQVSEFVGGAGALHDDLTVVCVKRLPAGS